VIVTIGYLGEQITQYFGDEWQGKKMTYVEQTVLNGTGGSIHAVKVFLEENFLVTMGDDLYVQSDLEQLLALPYGILGLHTKEAERFGILEVNEKNELMGVTERPHGSTEGFINTGGYMLGKEFFGVPLVAITETEFGLPQTLATLSDKITIPVITCTAWQPVGSPEDIPKAEEFITKYYL
jgi:NDP-sugar pyrophosphorylase family protein